MTRLGVGDGALTWFALAAHEPHHVAFKVTETVLDGAISRLRQRGVPFGMMHGIAQRARVRVARQPDASAAAATVSRTASRISCSGQYWLAGW